jgi:hypothetical protein
MAKNRKTGGRQAGTPNKATAAIKALALEHAETAIAELGRLALAAKSDSVRVAAIKELLDRGIGRAPAAPEDNEEAIGHIVKFITGFSNPQGGPKRG